MGIFYEPEYTDDYDYGDTAPADEYIEIPDRVLLSRRSSHSIAVEYGVTATEIDAARRQVLRSRRLHTSPPPRRPSGHHRPPPRRPSRPRVVDHRRGKKRKRKVRVSRSVLRRLLGGGWF